MKNYDYSNYGAYFVTVCTKGKRRCSVILQETVPSVSRTCSCLNTVKSSGEEIAAIEQHYQNVVVDKYVIMPNHIHMIVFIGGLMDAGRLNPSPTKRVDIPNIIGKFKAGVTRRVGDAFMHPAKGELWQRSYHDHIIRDETDYQKIWLYIDTNPVKWKLDRYYIAGRKNHEQGV